MRRVTACCCALALAVPGALMGATAVAADPSAGAQSSGVERRVRYAFTVQNETGRVLEGATFTAYAPVTQTGTQTLLGVSSATPATAEVDALGNRVLRFTLDALPPFSARVLSLEARLAIAGAPRSQELSGWLHDTYTRPERYVESADPRIVSLARSLKTAGARDTARNLYQWVRQNLRRLQYTPEDLGALRALELRAGDCTEHAYLFVALARAAGIPARALGGFVMPESGVLDPRDYHNWAEFYAEGAWHVADAHRGVFDAHASDYVAMRLISSSVPSPLGSSHRYASGSEGLKVKMN